MGYIEGNLVNAMGLSPEFLQIKSREIVSIGGGIDDSQVADFRSSPFYFTFFLYSFLIFGYDCCLYLLPNLMLSCNLSASARTAGVLQRVRKPEHPSGRFRDLRLVR
jgi:hypothetical protein